MKTIMMPIVVLVSMIAAQTAMAGCCGDATTGCKADGKDGVCPTGTCQAPVVTPAASPTTKEGVINTEALATLLRAKVPVTVLDARTGKFDDGRRVPGAKALAPTAKDEEVTAMLPDKKALVVTYCVGLKCPASHILGEKLRSMGYTNVLEYHEGIEGWVAAGNAVDQVPK